MRKWFWIEIAYWLHISCNIKLNDLWRKKEESNYVKLSEVIKCYCFLNVKSNIFQFAMLLPWNFCFVYSELNNLVAKLRKNYFKGATKLDYMNYLRVVIILFSTGWYINLHFLPILLLKLSFNFSGFWFFVFLYRLFSAFSFSVLYFEFNVISKD